MKLAEILASTAEPAFAANDEGQIVGWNRAAEELTGNTAQEVIGKPCHEVLCGRDIFGNRYCEESCSIANMARLQEPIRPFQLEMQTATGARLLVEISILVLPESEDSEMAMIHIFSPVGKTRSRGAQQAPLPVVADAEPQSAASSAPRGEPSRVARAPESSGSRRWMGRSAPTCRSSPRHPA